MAYDLASRSEGGKDWSCGIGSDRAPKAAIAAGAAVISLCVAGLLIASSLGGKRRATSGPPTMFATPSGSGYQINPAARRYFG